MRMSNDKCQMKPAQSQMRMPHYSAFVLVSFLLSLAFLNTGSATCAEAQQHDDVTNQDTARAIETHQQGDATKAINQLQAIVEKRPDDANAWYYLGLALNSQGFIGNSTCTDPAMPNSRISLALETNYRTEKR